MPRELDDKDVSLLKRLAPELDEIVCEHSGVPYRSILPPLANHFARDLADFERRLGSLNNDELSYLVDLVMRGLESLSCMNPDYAEVFLRLVEDKISKETAKRVTARYIEGICEL